MSPPLQRLLGLKPTSVPAGLFLYMGLRVAIRQPDPAAPAVPPLARVGARSRRREAACRLDRRARLHADAAHLWRDAYHDGAEFPLIITALVPMRLVWFGRFWSRETLRHADAWACREGGPEDEDDGEADGDDGDDDDLDRDADGGDGSGDAVSGRKQRDNLVDLERDAVVATMTGGRSSNRQSSNWQAQNGRRRSGHI